MPSAGMAPPCQRGKIPDRSATPASNVFRTGRLSQSGDIYEQAFWKDALKKEELPSANLLGNQLDGEFSGLSFLRSSTAGGGEPWLAVAKRQPAMRMTLRRLNSAGALTGSLQLSSSCSSLPGSSLPALDVDPTVIPDDFLPPTRDSASRGSSRPTSSMSSLDRSGQGGVKVALQRSGSILALGSRGVELAQPVTMDEKITLAMFDRRRPRPRPVMTEQQGFNVSSSLFTRYAGFHAPTYPTSLRRST